MKSFADWTDEIRALMNPPAPMVDTCNLVPPTIANSHLWECTPKGTIKWHNEYELAKRGFIPLWQVEKYRELARQDIDAAESFRRHYLHGDWGFDLGAPEGDQTATAIARQADGRTCFDRLREEGLRAGRRIGKSRVQQETNKLYGRLADHIGGVQWDEAYRDMVLTGHGVAKIIVDEFHDETQIKIEPLAWNILDLGSHI